jgi:ABC-type multidrug transport system fused ATPase/permease subunit
MSPHLPAVASRGILADTLWLLLGEASSGVRARLIVAMLLVITGALLSAAAPLALKALVDALAAQQAATGLPASALALGGIYLLALCSGRLLAELRVLLTATAEQALSASLGRRFFGHMLALPLGFHVGHQSGALVQTLRQATAGCQLLVFALVNGIAPVVVEVAAVMAVLVHLDQPALVLSFAASAAAYLTVCGTGALRLRPRARAVSEASLGTHAALADSLINIETIKCFNAEGSSRAGYEAAANELEGCWARLYRQRARTGLAVTATFAVSMATSLVLAAQALDRGSLSIGGFVLVTVYMLQLVRPLELLGSAARDLAQSLEFTRPLLDVLRTPIEGTVPGSAIGPAVAVAEGPKLVRAQHTTPACDASLSLRGVHLAYAGGQRGGDRTARQG